MSEPIVFVSHFKMKEGKLDAYRELQQDIAAAIEREKPGTGVFLAFLDPGGTDATIIHVFRDATAMDAHFEGSERRSKAASEVMVPAGWELYGSPGNAVIENIRQAAASSGVSLALAPDYVAGYVRSAELGDASTAEPSLPPCPCGARLKRCDGSASAPAGSGGPHGYTR